MLMRSDKVEGGKPLDKLNPECQMNDHRLHKKCLRLEGQSKRVTLNQSYRQGKEADRRMTNYVSIVKVTQTSNWWSGECEGRATVRLAKPVISGEVLGISTQRPRRCKSRRYASKRHLYSNWGDPVKSSIRGKGGYKVADPPKVFPVLNRESVMTIVAIVSGDSKTPESEGSLAFSGLSGGRSV